VANVALGVASTTAAVDRVRADPDLRPDLDLTFAIARTGQAARQDQPCFARRHSAMMADVEEVAVVVAHSERATVRVGDVFLKIDSDQARTAKFQGSVLLWMIVGEDGLPKDIRIVRSVGLGLDERAMETVKTWRFDPGRKDGHPVATQINVEVSFRLY